MFAGPSHNGDLMVRDDNALSPTLHFLQLIQYLIIFLTQYKIHRTLLGRMIPKAILMCVVTVLYFCFYKLISFVFDRGLITS